MSFYSRGSAADLADLILAARTHNRAFDLDMVIIKPGEEEQDACMITVREIREAQRMASGQEVIHCAMTTSGRLIDIYLPPPHERSISIAEILIQVDQPPGNRTGPA